MATVSSHEPICKIFQDRILSLEDAGISPYFCGFVLIEDSLLFTDYSWSNLQIYNRQDCKQIARPYRLESGPQDVCVLNDTQVAVCLYDSKIVVLSIKSINDVKRIKTLNLQRSEFNFRCDSVVTWNSDKIIVSGKNDTDSMLYWCVVSVEQESLDSNHIICKVKGHGDNHLAIRNDTLYVSCYTEDSITSGVYFFDILNPEKPKFLYQNQNLNEPWSVMADMFYVYVYDRRSKTMHQLTLSGQLVTVHNVSSDIDRMFYDDRHGYLYTTSLWSNVITVYRMEYPHIAGIPLEILKMDDRAIQLFEEALEDGKETVYSIRVMVVGEMSVGKTTLIKRLLGDDVNILERSSTEGIDVYVNCFNISLSTHEWTRQSKDSKHDYKLQRLVKVINENYQKGGRERPNGNPMEQVAGVDNVEVQSDQQNVSKNLSSTSSLQMDTSSNLDQSSLTQYEANTTPRLQRSENASTEYDKADPLREMLKLLQQNLDKAKQDVTKYAQLTMLDFAGQYAFYTTHQMFLARRVIYLLVLDSSREICDLVKDEVFFDMNGIEACTVHDLVDLWMNSIHSCASTDKESVNSANTQASSYKLTPPPVILVGTHIDQIPKNQKSIVGELVSYFQKFISPVLAQQLYCRKYGQRYLKEIRSYLRDKPTAVHLVDEDFAIDNTVVDSELEKLKKKIVEVASQQPYWGEQIPTRWFLLEQQLMRLKDAGMKVISRIAVEDLNKKGTVQIKQSEELDLFLKYLHETGTVIYFSIEVLRDNIVLDPKWLIDALKSLINAHSSLPNTPTASTGYNYITQKWSEFKEKGILTFELIDAVWTKESYPDLYDHKDYILMLMEQFNIIARPRVFTEIGQKEENYFLAPCILRQETPREIISPEQDPLIVSTPFLCFVFTGKFLPPPIFHRLLAACVTRWPVAKKETSDNLIFCGSCIFNLDLFHRLVVYCKDHIIFARITRLVVDDVKTPDAKLCTRVGKFIMINLSNITCCLSQNLQYELKSLWSPTEDGIAAPFQMWNVNEVHDFNAPIVPEHINHTRVYVALVTVCANVLRDILITHVPAPHKNIYHAILANKDNLTSRKQTRKGQWQNALLSPDQYYVVFPDPYEQYMASVDQFDISVLYILIRNFSTVPASLNGWGSDPSEEPTRDRSLGASVERIRLCRNQIGHSIDGEINQHDFEELWNKIDAVLDDTEQVLGRQGYRAQLEKQKRQVISVYEAC